MTTKKRFINEIIVHCTDTPAGRNVTVEQIREWHIARHFADIGYHYVIYLDGSIHVGRDEAIIGAHCKNHNKYSIGICYVGGRSADYQRTVDTRTPAQKKALLNLIAELKQRYPTATVHGHNEYANKACPCFNAFEEYEK